MENYPVHNELMMHECILLHKYRCCMLLIAMYFNGNKSCVSIREFSWASADNAQLLIMLVTRRHAKHMQNYEYLNWALIMHVFKSVLA